MMQAVRLMTKVPYGNREPMRLPTVDPIQYRATDPSAPPAAISRYFCNAIPPLSFHAEPLRKAQSLLAELFCVRGSRRDMTPRQNSLSGVIICPAYWIGQRLG